jgi:hypothetical protein
MALLGSVFLCKNTTESIVWQARYGFGFPAVHRLYSRQRPLIGTTFHRR